MGEDHQWIIMRDDLIKHNISISIKFDSVERMIQRILLHPEYNDGLNNNNNNDNYDTSFCLRI